MTLDTKSTPAGLVSNVGFAHYGNSQPSQEFPLTPPRQLIRSVSTDHPQGVFSTKRRGVGPQFPTHNVIDVTNAQEESLCATV